jgi:peptidoglycan/xylan/chitin deacetylase (PgdA/CDA1 family)
MAKKVVDAGHQAASHSYSHAPEHYLSATTPDDVRTQLSKAREAIGAAVGYEPTLVRPPGGNVNVEAMKAAGDLADGYIGWSIDPHDYERPGADAIASTILSKAAPGAIVLLHDGGGDRAQTVEALKKVIPELQKQGYSFVTIDELIAAVRGS